MIVITRVLRHFKGFIYPFGYLEVNQLFLCLGVLGHFRLIWYIYFGDIAITVV